MTRIITPSVNSDVEYWGAVDDFADRREIIREAISNSVDAHSNNVSICIEIIEKQNLMTIIINDDGDGMSPSKLENNFFSLGESSKLNEDSIGEKGHGTKTYICGERLLVNTVSKGINSVATMNEPLSSRPNIPPVEIEEPKKVDQKNGTEVIIENINIDSRDLDKFRFGSLKAYIKWHTAGGKTSWIWDEGSPKTKIKLSVSGYQESEVVVKGNKKVKNNGKDIFENLFEWKFDSNDDLADPKNMYMYYEPEIFPVPNSKHELRLAFASLGQNEKERLLSGSGFKVEDRMGAYLSKDGINIEHHGAGWLTNSQEWSQWIVLADTQGWALTQNRGSIRRDSFYDEVIKIVKNQFKIRAKPPKELPSETITSQANLFVNTKTIPKPEGKKIDFSDLATANNKENNKTEINKTNFKGKKAQNKKSPDIDVADFMRKKTLAKNFGKVQKEFTKNSKNLSALIETITPNLVQPDSDGKINFSTSPGGLVRKCENLQDSLDFEIEFAYPIFSKSNKSIPWVGSINRKSKSIKAVFHHRFEELITDLPFLEEGMVVITDKQYKIKSKEFEVKTGGFDYGVCELINSKGKNNIEFKPIIDDKTKIVIEMLFV